MKTNDIDTYLDWAFQNKPLLRELFAADKEKARKTPCLTDEKLTEILENRLSSDQVDSAMAHLAWCDDCMDIFVTTYQALKPETVSLTDKIASKIKSSYERIHRFTLIVKMFPDYIAPVILGPGFVHVQSPVTSPIRGHDLKNKTNLTVVAKKIPPFLFELEIEKIEGGLCQIQIYVKDIKSERPVNNLRFSLCSDKRELASYITEKGKVIFDEVEKGRYLIKASYKGEPLCEFDLSLV